MILTLKRLVLLVIALGLQITSAHAQLLISPTRVVLDERQRSSKVILINPTAETRTYRLKWLQKKANPDGGYINLTEEETETFAIASSMLRISPKQVTLAPNEKQVVKILARRPKNLADGEYRSHLAFVPLPKKKKKEEDSAAGASIKLEVLMSFNIPVILRQGKPDSTVTVEGVEIFQDTEKQHADLFLNLSRVGGFSTTGKLFAFWQPKGSSSEDLVTQIHGYNLYSEIDKYRVRMGWSNFEADSGVLRIQYEGEKEFKGKVLAERSFNISPSMIKPKPKPLPKESKKDENKT